VRRCEIDLQAVVSESVEELAPAFPDRQLGYDHQGQSMHMADSELLCQVA
jgi:hypothetical protein